MDLVQKEARRVEDNFEPTGIFGLPAELISNLDNATNWCQHLVVAAGVQQLDHLVLSLQLGVLVQLGDVTKSYDAIRLVLEYKLMLLEFILLAAFARSISEGLNHTGFKFP